jgi:hypothetical protein
MGCCARILVFEVFEVFGCSVLYGRLVVLYSDGRLVVLYSDIEVFEVFFWMLCPIWAVGTRARVALSKGVPRVRVMA